MKQNYDGYGRDTYARLNPKQSTCSKTEQVQNEENRQISQLLDFYNLNAVIVSSYKVTSKLSKIKNINQISIK
ncbi:hypothetical protein [Anaerofustis sp.]|uniref:hypothetical protein n=1 Tax=Anaerofustis sp. TaxID=1872517 RepID=UPI0025C5AC1C|nr:hypothetical protein [Anaerofustis sp.]